jgi:hypothetical protein
MKNQELIGAFKEIETLVTSTELQKLKIPQSSSHLSKMGLM